MGIALTVRSPRVPDVGRVLEHVGNPAPVWRGLVPTEGAWPEGVVHVAEDGVSVCGVDLSRVGLVSTVRTLPCSSAEDHRLALRFVEAFAGVETSRVEAEAGDSFPAGELRHRYDDAWIRRQVVSDARSVRDRVSRDGGVVPILGCRREAHVGPRTLEPLDRPWNDKFFADALLRVIGRVQWIEDEGWTEALVLRVPRTDGGKSLRAAVWTEGIRTFFPAVERLLVDDHGTVLLEVVARDLVAVAGDHFVEWLDDRQALVEGASGNAWRALVGRARACGVPVNLPPLTYPPYTFPAGE